MKRLLAIALCSLAAQAQAGGIDRLQDLSQQQFRALSEDLGAAFGYKGLVPAEPLGLAGFDVGVEMTATRLDNPGVADRASRGGYPDTLVVPKVHAHKGLPAGLDVGGFYGEIADGNGRILGAELRYALLEGGVGTPALAVRASYSRLEGVSQLALDTRGVDLMLSKGLGPLTPYAGVGRRWVESRPDAGTGLGDERFSLGTGFVGLNFNLGGPNLAVEVDKTGDAVSYGVKLGLRF
jgi:hypothetical protein